MLGVLEERLGKGGLEARDERSLGRGRASSPVGGRLGELVRALCRGSWDRVQEVDELEQRRQHRLDEGLLVELVSVEVADLVVSEKAEMEELAELGVALHVENKEESSQGLLDELGVDPYPLRVLQEVDALGEDQAEDGLAA